MDGRTVRSALRGPALLVAAVVGLASGAAAQDAPAARGSEDSRYYDFWPGTWVEVVDGYPDTTATRFTVRRGVHAAAFEEEWRLFYDGAEHRSRAFRAWDDALDRWRFVWVSDDGHFQVWEGEKVDGEWYIVREFETADGAFLSRQAWIPESEDRLIRVMERSFDGGRTWETRSRTPFVRVSGG